MREILLFTTPTCPNCPTAKEYLKEIGVDFRIIDATIDIVNRAKYRIMSAPTVVVLEDGGVVGKYIGTENIKENLR